MTFSYSVVIPAYNAAATIGQSVQSILEQTIRPQEIIVVDDGSTDNIAAAIAGMRTEITLIRQDNRGPGAATTAGIRHAERLSWRRWMRTIYGSRGRSRFKLPSSKASLALLGCSAWLVYSPTGGSRSKGPGRHTAPVDAHHACYFAPRRHAV